MLKIRHIISILLMAMMLTSCHSHRKVMRGSDAREVGRPKVEDTKIPKYQGKADNKVTTALLEEAYSWLGTPYLYGGKTRKGADCSGFVMVVYHDALDIDLPRVSRDQGEYCSYIRAEDLFPGDLVFFVTGNPDKVSHVGIYVGDGKMIHASSKKGVIVSDLTTDYYVRTLHHCGRVDKYHELIKKKGK